MTDQTERNIIVRSYEAELTEGDGRTLDLRIVPYNVVQRVADPPSYEPYDEMWVPGAFERQLEAAHRVKVWLKFEHGDHPSAIIGRGVELHEDGQSLRGSFRLRSGSEADMALEFVRDGFLSGVSLEAIPIKSVRRGGVVQRLRAHLDKVALVRTPAYTGAEVLAIRGAIEDDDPPKIPDWARPTPIDPALVEAVSRYADVPDRYLPDQPNDQGTTTP